MEDMLKLRGEALEAAKLAGGRLEPTGQAWPESRPLEKALEKHDKSLLATAIESAENMNFAPPVLADAKATMPAVPAKAATPASPPPKAAAPAQRTSGPPANPLPAVTPVNAPAAAAAAAFGNA